jgi:hypothetical protein
MQASCAVKSLLALSKVGKLGSMLEFNTTFYFCSSFLVLLYLIILICLITLFFK